jgi:hypothetical protein
MMMPSTQSGRFNTQGASSFPRRRYQATGPSTQTVKTALGITNAKDPIDLTSIGTMTGGTATQKSGKFCMLVITKIISLCGFPANSIVVRFIEQLHWTELQDGTTTGADEVKGIFTSRSNGTYNAKPMMVHPCMFKALLYCM